MRKSFKVLLFALIAPIVMLDLFLFNMREVEAFNQKYILPHIVVVKHRVHVPPLCSDCQRI